MAVYDEEKQDTRPSAGGEHDDLGVHPERREAEAADLEDRFNAPSAQKSLSDEDLSSAEASGATPEKTKAESQESNAATPDDQVGKGFTGGKDTKKKGRFSRRQKVVGGGAAAGGIIALAVVVSTFIQGPLQFIHKAQLLQRFHFSRHDDFGDDRSAKFILYSLSGKAAKGRLGFLSNKVADKWEKRLNNDSGLRSVYDKNTGRHIGYQVLDGEKAHDFLVDLENDGIPRSSSLSGTDINGKPLDGPSDFIDTRDAKYKVRRSIIRTATRSIGINRVSSTLGSRLLIKRAGVDFHPLKNLTRKKTDDFFKWREDKKKAKAEEHRTGNQTDLDAPSKDDPDAPDPDNPRSKTLTKLRSFVNTAKGPLLAGAVVCGIREFSSNIDAQNYENQLQLMRLGMDGITMGSQVMSNRDVSVDILGAFDDYHYDEETKTSWTSDPGIQQELGEEPTGIDYNKDNKPGKEKPLIFQVVDKFPVPGVPGTSADACDAYNVVGSLPVIKQAGALFSAAVDAGLSAFNIPTADDLMAKAIDYFSTGGVDLFAEGAKRGGMENIGTRLASNDQFIAMGGRELSDQEASQSKSSALANDLEFSQGSVFAKYFDIYNGRSASGRLAATLPSSFGQIFARLTQPVRLFGDTLISLPNDKVAAEAAYSYGFPLYGFSNTERENSDYQDPYENGVFVEEGDRLERMNKDYGNECFGMTISREGNLQNEKSIDFTKLPDKCKDTSNAELARYRFYLADMASMHALVCYEGADEDSCRQVGFGAQASAAGATNGDSKIVGDPYTDSSSVPCDPRTKDLGLADGYEKGNKFTVRLCSVSNFPSSGQADKPGSAFSTPGADGHAVVNSRVSGAWFTLVQDASTAGRNLRARSSFRSMEHQRSLCNANANCRGGGSEMVAQPGYSSHQAGVAIDFEGISGGGNSGSCSGRARDADNPDWVWLRDNAENYGFKQYSAEAWHWDALPSANRCGAAQG